MREEVGREGGGGRVSARASEGRNATGKGRAPRERTKAAKALSARM